MHPLLSRRRLLTHMIPSLSTVPFFGITGCATPTAMEPDLVKAFAPTGRLRASINLGNPILARRNPASGEVFGVSVDLARALAQELGVAMDLVVFDAAAKSVEAVKTGQADIASSPSTRCAATACASARPMCRSKVPTLCAMPRR